MFLRLHWFIVLVLADIRMEKLIELLTEHSRNHYWFKSDDDIEIDTDSICFHLYHKWKRCFPIRVETVICKDFWFIKWLVDNDKIDFRKLEDNGDWYDINTGNEYLDILALLSIQDNPVELLVSILK